MVAIGKGLIGAAFFFFSFAHVHRHRTHPVAPPGKQALLHLRSQSYISHLIHPDPTWPFCRPQLSSPKLLMTSAICTPGSIARPTLGFWQCISHTALLSTPTPACQSCSVSVHYPGLRVSISPAQILWSNSRVILQTSLSCLFSLFFNSIVAWKLIKVRLFSVVFRQEKQAKKLGIHILALIVTGAPSRATEYNSASSSTPNQSQHAMNLVQYIRPTNPNTFCLGAACHPEGLKDHTSDQESWKLR